MAEATRYSSHVRNVVGDSTLRKEVKRAMEVTRLYPRRVEIVDGKVDLFVTDYMYIEITPSLLTQLIEMVAAGGGDVVED